MNTKQIGDISESAVIAALLKSGANVLIPFGDRNRYDVVVEDGGMFYRIQIKTGRLRKGGIFFKTESSTRRNGKRFEMGYRGQIDFFAVYCHDLDRVYLVPIDSSSGGECCLRVSIKPKGNHSKIRMADKFLFGSLAQFRTEHSPVTTEDADANSVRPAI